MIDKLAWPQTDDVQAMLHLTANDGSGIGAGPNRIPLSPRKLRLIACAAARIAENSPPHPTNTAAIAVCEQVADSEETSLGKGIPALLAARTCTHAVWGWPWCATCPDIAVGIR